MLAASMRALLGLSLVLLASVSRCDAPGPAQPPPEPRPGDAVQIRGRLDEDVDCRLLRADDGKVYSLSERLPRLRDGSRVCVHGTIASVSQCMRTPMIEVSEVRPYSNCR
jgi:hypothetical protein